MPNAIHPATLGRTFARMLHAEIGADNMREVVSRNEAEAPDSDVCHSHDFCDANMVMLAAAESYGLPSPVAAGSSPAMMRLWGDAWDCAKARFFGREVVAPALEAAGYAIEMVGGGAELWARSVPDAAGWVFWLSAAEGEELTGTTEETWLGCYGPTGDGDWTVCHCADLAEALALQDALALQARRNLAEERYEVDVTAAELRADR